MAAAHRRYKHIYFFDRFKRVNKMAKTIDDVIDLGSGGRPPRRPLGRRLLQVALLALIVASGWLLYHKYAADPNSDVERREARPFKSSDDEESGRQPGREEVRARQALARGEYARARQIMDQHQLPSLSRQLHEGLGVSFFFKYDMLEQAPVHNDRLQLPIKTPYYAILSPQESCYLYFLQRNTAGEWRLLFPQTLEAGGGNPVIADSLWIPENGRFLNETGPGTETLYLLATRWRQEKLEQLVTAVTGSSGHEQQILDYIDSGLTAKLEYPGVVCKKIAFDHL